MYHSTPPFPIDWLVKRQCRVAQDQEDGPNYKNTHGNPRWHKHRAHGWSIPPKQETNKTNKITFTAQIPVSTNGALMADFRKFYTTMTPLLNQPSDCSICTFAYGNATLSNLPRIYDSRMSSNSFGS